MHLLGRVCRSLAEAHAGSLGLRGRAHDVMERPRETPRIVVVTLLPNRRYVDHVQITVTDRCRARDRTDVLRLTSLIYRCASRLNEATVVRMPSAYGVPAKPNSLPNLLESKRYGPSLWYSIS